MSRIIFLLLFVTMNSLSLYSQAKTEEIIIKTNIYCDHCKECGSCLSKIEHELSFEKGIKVVRLNVERQEITVKYNPAKTNAENIKKAINKIGFDADDQLAPEEFVNKLDDCCKKK